MNSAGRDRSPYTIRNSSTKMEQDEMNHMEHSELIGADPLSAEQKQMRGAHNIKGDAVNQQSQSKEGTVASIFSADDRKSNMVIGSLRIGQCKDTNNTDLESSACFLYEGLAPNPGKLVTMQENEPW